MKVPGAVGGIVWRTDTSDSIIKHCIVLVTDSSSGSREEPKLATDLATGVHHGMHIQVNFARLNGLEQGRHIRTTTNVRNVFACDQSFRQVSIHIDLL